MSLEEFTAARAAGKLSGEDAAKPQNMTMEEYQKLRRKNQNATAAAAGSLCAGCM